MAHPLRGASCITGIGETAVGSLPKSTALTLMEDAARSAIMDAGLTPRGIDGIITGRSMVEPLHRVAVILAERLGIQPSVFATLEAGGATSVQMLVHAAMAIATGAATNIVCIAGDNLLTGLTRDAAVQAMAENAHAEFEVPLGTFPAAAYAMVARAHMHEFHTTRKQLADVAVSTRAWAQKNPPAQAKDPLNVEDALLARMIADPLGLFDCSLVSDGAGAFVVSEAEGAEYRDHFPIWILGVGEAATHEYITNAPSLTHSGAVKSGASAFDMAGVSPPEIDVAELYDCFTITPIILLEDLGFCKKGEGGPFVEDGRTGPDGDFPMNTHGGLLSHAHPGKPGGIFHLTEAVRQLRGNAEDRQIADAHLATVHGVGGMFSAHATAILGTEK